MSINSNHKVSIGLPVYNGEDFIAEAIQSVLDQTYDNIELVICDNGSTDGTASICRQFADQSDKIFYYRYEENRGAAWNYNQTFQLSTGDYFRWLAADDYLAPELVERSVAVLDERPEVVLAFTAVVDIDADGNRLTTKRSTVNSDKARPSERFRGLAEVRPSHNCEEIFGLMRRDVLADTKLIESYADSDRTLLADLGLRGQFSEINEPLFFHRLHDKGSVTANRSRHARASWFDPGLRDKLVFPNWRQLREMLLLPARASVPLGERVACYQYLVIWTIKRRRHLRNDLKWAFRTIRGTN